MAWREFTLFGLKKQGMFPIFDEFRNMLHTFVCYLVVFAQTIYICVVKKKTYEDQ